MPDQSVYLLPPRPRRRDWLSAGLTAGGTLGLMELLVAIPGDLSPPPTLAILLAGVTTVLVGVTGLCVGVAVEWRSGRLTHSGMVGAMLGPLVGAGLPGALWSQLPPAAGSALGLSGLTAVALFAAAAGLAGSRLCEALENGGVPVSAPLVWGATALSMASGERILAENPGGVELAILVAAPGLALLGVVVGHERARRRGANLIVHPTRALGTVCGVTVLVALLPWLWPWLLYEEATLNLEGTTPSFVLVALDDTDPVAAQATIDLIAWNGVAYRKIAIDSPGGANDVLRTPDGSNLFARLDASGYSTHAVLTSGAADARWRADSVDARPGPGGLLAGPLRWMASAPLLVDPGSPWLEGLGFGGALREPHEIVDAAGNWLLEWRATRAPAPFFLFVDFRRPESAIGGVASESDIETLIDHLDTIGVTQRTALLGLVFSADGVRAAIRPPPGIAHAPRNSEEIATIGHREWVRVVLDIATRVPAAAPTGAFVP